MNKRKWFVALLALFALASLACGPIDSLVNKATGGNTMRTVSTLWTDVPPMEGLKPSRMNMPLPVKVLMSTVLGNMGRLNPTGQDQTTGAIDWIVFASDKSTEDIQSYYTTERMAADGWDTSEGKTCFSASEQGYPAVGVVCVFAKHEAGKDMLLAIIAVKGDKTTKTNVFFLRLEVTPTPVPSQ